MRRWIRQLLLRAVPQRETMEPEILTTKEEFFARPGPPVVPYGSPEHWRQNAIANAIAEGKVPWPEDLAAIQWFEILTAKSRIVVPRPAIPAYLELAQTYGYVGKRWEPKRPYVLPEDIEARREMQAQYSDPKFVAADIVRLETKIVSQTHDFYRWYSVEEMLALTHNQLSTGEAQWVSNIPSTSNDQQQSNATSRSSSTRHEGSCVPRPTR